MPKPKPPIVNRVLDCPTIPWAQVKKWEANRLKDSEKRNVQKLKANILKEGFCFALVAWNPGNGVDPIYVIDGAGRIAALTQLEKDGHEIGDLPVIFVEAENREQAKRLVASASSQFGTVTADTFAAFVQDLGGADALLPTVSISSSVFASDYLGPAIPSEEASKKRNTAPRLELPDFLPEDIVEFGPHQLMVGHEQPEIIAKIVKLLRKDFPDLPLTRNGEGF